MPGLVVDTHVLYITHTAEFLGTRFRNRTFCNAVSVLKKIKWHGVDTTSSTIGLLAAVRPGAGSPISAGARSRSRDVSTYDDNATTLQERVETL